MNCSVQYAALMQRFKEVLNFSSNPEACLALLGPAPSPRRHPDEIIRTLGSNVLRSMRLLRHAGAHRDVNFGSWSCENTLAEALTLRDFGEVDVLGHFAEFGGSSVWKLRLMRIAAAAYVVVVSPPLNL